jgi:Zn ribbon nucleic-acid-binding protein
MALPTQMADGTAAQCPQCHSALKIFSIRGNTARIALCVSCMKGFSIRESSSTTPEKPGSTIQ